MKLNKGSLFALFAVLELASNGDRQLSTTDIAEKYGISTHHLAKVMRNLVHSGLVQAVRGVGGYTDFALMEDYLLWAKMIAAGAQVVSEEVEEC